MTEILALRSGTVIRGGAEVFAVLRDVRKGKITLPEAPVQKTTKGPKPKPITVSVVTPAKPRLERPRPKEVAKPKETETVEIKPKGDWFEKLQSLTATAEKK